MATAAPASPQRPSRPGTLVIAALVVVLGAQLAHWTWVFFAPAPVASGASSEGGADLAVAARLFGGSSSAPQGTAAAASSLRLKGVVAPTPGTAASAIFNTGSGRDVSIYIEGEVQPGVKLVEVLPDAAVVSRAGVRERIELDKRLAAVARAPGGAAPYGTTTGFRVNVARTGGNNFTLSRKELDNALKDPAQLGYLGRIGAAPEGGVRMESAPPGSLAAKLGLQSGDVIKKINGKLVLSQGDLALLYGQFSSLSMVQAEVQRGATSLQMTFSIQP
jgi:type II secretory pathway component PulC